MEINSVDINELHSEKIMLVGLCGRSGSGKGYVADIFKKFGIPSIDTDEVYRKITGPGNEPSDCMKALTAHFGENVLSPDNSLNREVMRGLVFGEENKSSLNALNNITHGYILMETINNAVKLSQAGIKIILIDAPLLFESGFNRLCEKNICVVADEETVIRRIIKRDGITRENAEKRLATQKSIDELKNQSDYIIENNCEKDELIRRVKFCADELLKIYKEKYLTSGAV